MSRRLDVLMVLDYYVPYVSGLTNVARDVAEGLAERGHRVRVVAGRHDPALPERETVRGVEVERAPVLARIGKGFLSPALIARAVAASKDAGVTNVHLPMPEAGLVAGLVAGRARSPLAVTYHCDISLPPSLINRVQTAAVDLSSRAIMRRATRVVVTSEDYARQSRLWPAIDGRCTVIPPPCHSRAEGSPAFRRGEGLHVGFLGRIVEEKGLRYLVRGFQGLGDPRSRLLIAGDFAEVAGGSVIESLRRIIADDDRITLLGFVPEERLADFYASLDVFALPSVNAFEAFGIAQVEAMTAGVPVLASDLPGVRVPVRETGFGVVVPPRDVECITAGLLTLAARTGDRTGAAADALRRYGSSVVVDAYEELFAGLARRPT